MTEHTTEPVDRHDVTIQLDGHGWGHIHVDGREIHGVRGFTLTGHCEDVGRLELDLRVLDVSTHGEGLEVLIPEHTADTLRTLGWTPPAATDGGALDGPAFEELLRDVYRTTVCPEPYTAALVAEAGRARAEAARLRDALAAVLELHRPVILRGTWVCTACTTPDILTQSVSGRGRHGVAHPCATARAAGYKASEEADRA